MNILQWQIISERIKLSAVYSLYCFWEKFVMSCHLLNPQTLLGSYFISSAPVATQLFFWFFFKFKVSLNTASDTDLQT